MLPRTKHRIRNVLLALFVVAAGLVVTNSIGSKRATQLQKSIEAELQTIREPRLCKIISTRSNYKSSNGFTIKIVQTQLNANDIRSYYLQELPDDGWTFLKQEERLSKTRILFCRNQQTLILEFPGTSVQPLLEYSLSIVWGISYGCESE
jgi:hypothetical protein